MRPEGTLLITIIAIYIYLYSVYVQFLFFFVTGRFIAQPDRPWTAAHEVYTLDVTDGYIPTNNVCSHNAHPTIYLPGGCLTGRLPLARTLSWGQHSVLLFPALIDVR